MANLDVFEPETDLPPDFMMIMYGMRRSGKTTALMHMLESMKKRFELHTTHVFCGTAEQNPGQWRNFPLNAVHGDIPKINETLGLIIDKQVHDIGEEVKRQVAQKRMKPPTAPDQNNDKKVENNTLSGLRDHVKKREPKPRKRRRKDNHDVIPAESEKGPDNDLDRFPGEVASKQDDNREMTVDDIMHARRDMELDESMFPHVLIILDDVVSENSIRHAPRLNQLAVSGRHIFITAIILSQCVCGSGSVPPTIRNNSDYVLVVKNPRSRPERKLLEEQYLTASNKKDAGQEGLALMEAVTAVKFRILVINVSADGNNFRDYLFTYGPVPPPPDNVSRGFRLGTESQWEDDTKSKREPKFTSKDFLKEPPKGPDLQAIDSGRFSVGHSHGVPGDEHQSKGIQRFVSRHAEFLDPYF
jgi:hypothetical protein